jgi:hypothetical protein
MEQGEISFVNAVWASLRPVAVSWTVDLAHMLLFWASIFIAHLLQHAVLSQGWLPGKATE